MENIYYIKKIFKIFSVYSYFKECNHRINKSDIMDSSLIDDINSKLKLLTLISKGDKINVKTFGVQTDNIFTKINRSFINIDSRNNCLQFVKTTINKSFQILSFYINSESIPDKILCSNILQDIINSKQGIENLCSTYKDDLMVVCNFATIIQNIDSKLAGIKSSHPYLFKDIENFEVKHSPQINTVFNTPNNTPSIPPISLSPFSDLTLSPELIGSSSSSSSSSVPNLLLPESSSFSKNKNVSKNNKT
jgi:hypothetical protein